MECVLSLGSNVGNRTENLQLARRQIVAEIGAIRQKSSIFESEAWGKIDQPDFLNQVLVAETKLGPLNILHIIKGIEKSMGREKVVKWGPRNIDIDILFYKDLILNIEGLTIPHPGIPNRNFILIPLMEIMPYFVHPVALLPIEEMYWNSSDIGNVYVMETQ